MLTIFRFPLNHLSVIMWIPFKTGGYPNSRNYICYKLPILFICISYLGLAMCYSGGINNFSCIPLAYVLGLGQNQLNVGFDSAQAQVAQIWQS